MYTSCPHPSNVGKPAKHKGFQAWTNQRTNSKQVLGRILKVLSYEAIQE